MPFQCLRLHSRPVQNITETTVCQTDELHLIPNGHELRSTAELDQRSPKGVKCL